MDYWGEGEVCHWGDFLKMANALPTEVGGPRVFWSIG
jgi:hypothetical protein